MGAHLISELDGPSRGSGEEPRGDAHFDPLARFEHGSFDQSLVQPRQERARGQDDVSLPLGQLTNPALECWRNQGVSARNSASFSDGFIYPRVLRGRPLRLRSIAVRSLALSLERSVL